MFQVSRDNPAYYLTSVAHQRRPIFHKDSIKQIVCNAFDEARVSGAIMIFAYVIMPDHTHVVTDSVREMKDVLRYLNGVSARRVIQHLTANGLNHRCENPAFRNVKIATNIRYTNITRTHVE